MEEHEALEILKRHAPSEKVLDIVLAHSKAVQKAALRIAENTAADRETIRIGCLLHDIGRFVIPPGPDSVKHGIEGARILREEGLETYARIAERHLGAGITKEDIKEQSLPLPEQNYIPITIEEKIITYADNLMAGSVEKDLQFVVERYRRELGEHVAKRIRTLHEELESLGATL